MSQLAATSLAQPQSEATPSSNTPLRPRHFEPGSWQQCAAALVTVAALVFGGHAVGQVAGSCLELALPSVNAVLWRIVEPGVVAAYQVLLFWVLARWLVGPDRGRALAMTQPAIGVRGWLAVVLGLYAVKAVATMIAVLFLQRPEGGPVEALAPFAELMRLSFWPMLVLTGIAAAIAEEVIYRGFLSRVLEQSRLGFWLGAVVAATVWAALHTYYPLPIQVTLVALGVALSWVRRHTGSVYPGMLWHVINNTVGLLALKALA